MPVLPLETATPEQIRIQNEQVASDRHNALFGIDKWEDLNIYRRYARGHQAVTLTDEQKKILRLVIGNKFCDNVCHQIVSEARDRIIFRGWKCKAKKVGDWLESFRKSVNLDFRLSSIIYDTLRDGNHAVAVNWQDNKKKPQIYRENWWNGSDGVFITYNDTDEPSYAVKEWITDEGIRRNVWFDNRLERYLSPEGGAEWLPFRLDSDPEQWPIPWTKDKTPTGEPLHIPYIHFANNGQTFENYGVSELSGGVIGFQDQINDLHYAITAAGRFTGYQMVTVSGIVLVVDPVTGKTREVEVAPGMVLMSADKDTKWGVIPAGDCSQLIAILDKKMQRCSQMTRTPFHRISGGDWPSGEALLRSEQPAIGKAENQIKRLVSCMEMMGHRATEINNALGSDAKLQEDIEKAPVEADFMAPERRDPLSKSIIVTNLGDKISNKEALRIMEYSETEADQIIEEKKEEARNNADNMARAFDRGVGPGTNLPGKGPDPNNPNPAKDNQQIPPKAK
jgi:hypothetical protein